MHNSDNSSSIDLVLIGHYQKNLDDSAQKSKPYQRISGGYKHLKLHSLHMSNGKHYSFLELINKALKLTGKKEVNGFESLNYGLAKIASEVDKNGYSVKIVNCFDKNDQQLVALLKKKPKAVAITTTFYTGDDDPIVEIVEYVRAINSSIPIIVGGPRIYKIAKTFSTNFQKAAFTKIRADYYIVEQLGISTLVSLIGHLKNPSSSLIDDIPNLIIQQQDDNLLQTYEAADPLTFNESAVNWPIFKHDFDFSVSFLQTKRGCPFKCSFCTYHKLVSSYEEKNIQTIEQELLALKKNGARHIVFTDDSFNIPNSLLKDVCNIMIQNSFNFSWTSFLRASNVDDQCLELMAKSGCSGVILGIESGDQDILEKMNKKASVKKYVETITKLNDLNIPSIASLIVGHPGETKNSIKNTISFLEEASPTFFVLWLYYHDPLADIDSQKEKYRLSGRYYSWKHNTMDWKEALYWQKHMITTVKNSSYLDGSISFFSEIPLLSQQGIDLKKLRDTLSYLKKSLLHNLGDNPLDLDKTVLELSKVLS